MSEDSTSQLTSQHTPGMPSQRVCVIDLGTNSFHTIITDIYPNGRYEIIDRIKEMVRLGDGGLGSNQLSEGAMDRAREALARVRLLAEGHKVDAYVAYATSAIREAENGGDLIREVLRDYGIRIRPISGEKEAWLIYLAVRQVVSLPDPALLIDIGGGSTEFIIADRKKVYYKASFKMGAARLTEQFISTDPVEKKEFKALRKHLRRELEEVMEQARKHNVTEIVGSSGTMENLAAVYVNRYGDSDRSIYQQPLDGSTFRKVTKKLMKSTRSDREGMSGIDERRVDQVVAGVILVDVLVKDLKINQLHTSPHALREGIVEEFIQQHRPRLAQSGGFTSVRRRSVYEVGYAFRWDAPHAEHVAQLALRLFDACQPLHERTGQEREWLEYAALLHDIGHHISHRKHHKHTLYLILNAEFSGFQPYEIAIIGNVARYHRRSFPKKKHKAYASLKKSHREIVWELSALLRLAEGMDRSHFRNVKEIQVATDDTHVSIDLYTQAEPHLDVWGVRHSAALFEATFDRRVRVRAFSESQTLARTTPVFPYKSSAPQNASAKLD